jgi:hypothetical protein
MIDPITPPPALVDQWAEMIVTHTDTEVFSAAAQWGADQELEACCEWLNYNCPSVGAHHLSAARRPKPPSLKEQALEVFEALIHGDASGLDVGVIRRALEALPE